MFCCLVMSMGQTKNFWIPLRNQTSDLWILHCDALPLSCREPTESKAHKQVQIWSFSISLLLQNLPSPYSIYKTIEKLSTECCKNRTKVMAKSTKRNFARRQWELKVKTYKQHNAWENKITQVAVRSYFCISLLKNFLCFVLSSYILTL